MPQALQQIIENGRLALRLMNDTRVQSWVRFGIPIIVLIYFISPIDIIPDFIPGLGQLDDLTVILLGMSMMARFAPTVVVDEHRRALGLDVPSGTGSGTSTGTQAPKQDYWSTPAKGQQTTRINNDNGRPIDAEYKVVGKE